MRPRLGLLSRALNAAIAATNKTPALMAQVED
jgi:hypothetical protein